MIKIALVEIGSCHYQSQGKNDTIDCYWYEDTITDEEFDREIKDLRDFYDLVIYPERK